MAKLLVKQVRNNCPLDQKRIRALGLRNGTIVEHDSNPTIGMINKVKHLVSVEETK
jgi:large subunit ribosomal protein L30